MRMNLEDKFEKYGHEYLKFERIRNKLSQRPDIHALILLDRLSPPTHPLQDMLVAANHEQIWIGFKGLSALKDSHIIELLRCGVYYDCDEECLYLMV